MGRLSLEILMKVALNTITLHHPQTFSLNIFYLLKYAKRIRHKLNKLMKSSPTYNKLQHYLIEHAYIFIINVIETRFMPLPSLLTTFHNLSWLPNDCAIDLKLLTSGNPILSNEQSEIIFKHVFEYITFSLNIFEQIKYV
jgi:hypothetical protein